MPKTTKASAMYRLNENAGKLSEKITVTRELLASDGAGGVTVSWVTLGTFRACVEPISGRERDMASQTESPRNYRFILRHSTESAAILAKDKITWRGKAFNIRFVAIPDKISQFLRIDAEEGVAV